MRGQRRRRGFRRVSHGLFLPIKDGATAQDEVLRDLGAWLLVLPPGAVFTHLTGARLRGWQLPPLPEQVPVFAAVRGTARRPRRPGLICSRLIERAAPDPDAALERRHGLPVDSGEEILLRAARDLGLVDLTILLESALAQGDLDSEAVAHVLDSRRPGVRALRAAWQRSSDRAASAGESMLRLFHDAMQIPTTPQVHLYGEDGALLGIADLLVDGTDLVHEYDGAVHREGRQHRVDLRRERAWVDTPYRRRGFTLDDLLNHPSVVMHELDRTLSRRHDRRRVVRWRRWLDQSLYDEPGRRRLMNRWNREMGVTEWSPTVPRRPRLAHPARGRTRRRSRTDAGPAHLRRPTVHPMDRRIFGIENEYGVTCTFKGQRRLSPDEVARYLFRKVVSWGRSSNVFLRNGSRLYLDVGSHPEYATPECDDPVELVTHDKAGERILEGLLLDAEQRLHDEGIAGEIYLFKNNTDSAGNSYGCHENYLVGRAGEFSKLADVLIPFLVTRQIIVGAGKITQTPRGASYSVSQRAEHIWEGVSSATTRSRPIINTRDEPHADAERYRRLHVIVGDSNMSETTTLLKVASCDLVLRMIEEGVVMRDLTMENPIRAIREISHDVTGQRKVRLANGREASALDIQQEYLSKARDFVDRRDLSTPVLERVLDLWERGLKAVESDDLGLVDTEIDWVIKWKLIEKYRARHGLPLGHPRIAQLDLAYHDIHRGRGLYYLLEKRGQVARVSSDLKIFEAKTIPPQTTRARLRGEFIRTAQERRRDFTVDWVHLKLNDQAQRTVLCKDPFRAHDERVQRLIDGM